MDRVIYTALSGMAAQSRAQAVTANNLANAGTTGFRQEVVIAESRWLQAQAWPARAQAGAPSVATPQRGGRVTTTGAPLDVALAGNAWLAVQGPVAAGQPVEAYSRRGDLRVGPTGLIETGDGRPVLSQDGTPMTAPRGAALAIGEDGTVTARQGAAVQPLGRIKLVDGSALSGRDKAADGLFVPRAPLPADPAARLVSGALESANVETAAALVELVAEQRGFEVNARLLGIVRDLDERGARLMAMNGY